MPSAVLSKNNANLPRTFLVILIYLPLSIGITFYQQWFVKKEFRFPLFVVLCHYIIKFLFTVICRRIYTCCRGDRNGSGDWVQLEWRDYVHKVAAVGVAASVDIGLSNWSFQFITVSLYTMAKSSSIIFILIFAVLLSLEKCNLWTLVIVASIALGLFLFTYRSAQFDIIGFLLVELATVCAGIRWTCSQLLMQKLDNGLHHPLDMIYHVQPWMILGIMPLVFGFEGRALAHAAVDSVGHGALPVERVFGFIFAGAVIAFLMEVAEYALLVYTSSLTLNICGIAKEIVTLLLAHYYKGDQFSSVNIAGLFLCLTGVSLYVFSKAKFSTSKQTHSAKEDELALMNERIEQDDADIGVLREGIEHRHRNSLSGESLQ